MNQYYRATIKVSFEDKKGNTKFKKENYLVFAMTPTDVEAKLAKHLGMEDHEIISISVSNVVEVVQ